MKIKVKDGGLFKIEFTDYFKTIDSFKEFIKSGNEFINVDFLETKISHIYEELSNLDIELKTNLVLPLVIEKLDFKNKSAFKLEFWEERGYGIREFNNWICKRRNIQPVKKIVPGVTNHFKYGNYDFQFTGEPKCNLCGSELEFDILVNKYIIKDCKNRNCHSHNNKEVKTIRQLAFLPKDVFLSKNKRINHNSKLSKEYWLLKGLSLDKSKKEISKIRKQLKGIHQTTRDYYRITTDMSEDEIIQFLKEKSHVSPEYWVSRNFADFEDKIKEHQEKASQEFAKKRQENPEEYSAVTHTQIGYWINKGFSEDEAKEKLSERQTTFSLDICIKKYGAEEGRRVFTKRQKMWNKSLNEGGNLKIGYSKISQELFGELLSKYIDKETIYFATHNKEFRLEKDGGGVWLYDFVDVKKKKIIEYHGDMYHGNPKKYLAEDYPHPFRKNITAKEIWDKDEKKRKRAEKEGFEVLVVWDSEYRWGNKQKVVNKCLKFLGVDSENI